MTSGKKSNPPPNQKKNGKLTPMLTQYLEVKAQHPDTLLLFRMGDFYETFFEDAQILARVGGVALTSRDAKSANPVPLAGVPYHALDTYLNRLLAAGLTVAICEQTEDPALAKGLVRREVVEIISPGTVTSPDLLPGTDGRYCLTWVPGSPAGYALLDASTGDFRCGEEETTLASLCQRHPVREVLIREDTAADLLNGIRASLPEVVVNPVNDAWFHPAFARQTLLDHFQTANLAPFGLEDEERTPAVCAAGALLRYLETLTLGRPGQIVSLHHTRRGDRLALDEETLRNLEVFRTFGGERGEGTLYHHIDGTVTPLGARLLAVHLAEPLTDLDELSGWHAGVASLLEDRRWRGDLRTVLARVGDLERLAARSATGRIGPAGLRQTGDSLQALYALQETIGPETPPDHPAARWLTDIRDFRPLAERLLTALVPEAGATTRQGGFISAGVDADLDHHRSIAADSKGFLAGLQSREREATGISTLKVGFNRVFGYFFEVTNKHLDKVPDHYQQKQTLVNSARFHTEELKEAEATILAAEETAGELENRIFTDLVAAVADRLGDLREAARLCAHVDLMQGYAETAERHEYCRPRCDDALGLEITAGRHPVVEQILAHDFIPNDTMLDGDTRQVLLLTGPNMGGKSTYLRQIALITLMAQAGGFVPASSARIGVADRIFTRVGASDNLARGESTFYTEMSETAHILHQMTRRSLVILDEIGRGTSTYDGLSLAWAITEFLCVPGGPRPRSVFATHYHELTELEKKLGGLVNLRLEVKEWEGKIIFLHAVGPGRSDKSYGIHVARLAGLPERVLQRAQEILSSLSEADRRTLPAPTALPGGASLAAEDTGAKGPRAQLSLFNEVERDALGALRGLDLEKISPMEAFLWLDRIKRQLSD